MAYDERLAQRVRGALTGEEVTEKRMFGGITFMLGDKMCVGVLKDDLVVRVGPDGYEEALAAPHAREMDFTGRSLRGFVYVGPDGVQSDGDLETWVNLAVDFVKTLLQE
ncbi:MAG: TfoX/Sxy family protein [Thermoplasmata archaeon]